MENVKADMAVATQSPTFPVFSGVGVVAMRGERPVVVDAGFSLGAGDALILTGANGVGKSTLLRVMAGLLRPAAGSVSWHGVDIADDPDAHAARLGWVGHLDALRAGLTVRETLSFWATLSGAAGRVTSLDMALSAFCMSRLADRPVRQLSSGQRRRLALSRLLLRQVPLWLLDEPAVGLDVEGQELLANVMARHRSVGGLVVLTTHQPLALPDAGHLQLAARGDRT